jgi:hypothetical protein
MKASGWRPWRWAISSRLGRTLWVWEPPAFGMNPSGANFSVVYSAFRFFKIFFANGSLISLCRGTASIDPSFGLIQSECEAPSRFK